MKRKSKTVTEFDFKEKEPVIKEDVMSLNEFLSKHNGQRVLDKIIRGWYFKKDSSNPKKTVHEWSKLLNEFHNETER